MKKLAVVFPLVALAAVAQDFPPPAPANDNPSPVFMKRFGGYIHCDEPGSVVLVADARKGGVADNALLKEFRNLCFIPCAWQTEGVPTGECPYKVARGIVGDAKAYGAVVYLFDGDADAPVLTAYPENRVSLVNVTPLKAGVDGATYANRIHKEVWRAMCFAAGGTNSGTPYCVMRTVLSPADLDAIETMTASPNATGGISNGYKKFGFGYIRKSTYMGACRQGWAPAPTNEYQKAIWDRVNKERAEATKNPTNPMKIKFDKTKKSAK